MSRSVSVAASPRPAAAIPSKIDGLQMLRAIAVLLVTWLHSTQGSWFYFGITVPDSVPHRIANLGMFGVDIFFAISGFILTMVALRPGAASPRHQAANFIFRRLIRIYPIYWILLLWPIGRLLHQHRLQGMEAVRSLLLLPGFSVPIMSPLIGYAWTLIFEMFFYLTMTALILVNPRRAPWNTVYTLLLVVAVGAVVGIHHPVLIVIGNPILLEFVAGAMLAILFQRFVLLFSSTAAEISTLRSAGWAMLAAGLLVSAAVVWAFPGNTSIESNTLAGIGGWQRVLTWGIAGWLLTAGAVFLSAGLQAASSRAQPGWFARLAIFTGDASYSIYLSSAFTMEQYGRVLGHIRPPAVPGALLVNLTTLGSSVLVVLAGMAFHVWVERPLTSWLQHRIHSLPFSTARLPAPVAPRTSS